MKDAEKINSSACVQTMTQEKSEAMNGQPDKILLRNRASRLLINS